MVMQHPVPLGQQLHSHAWLGPATDCPELVPGPCVHLCAVCHTSHRDTVLVSPSLCHVFALALNIHYTLGEAAVQIMNL